jgi:HAMP domain-containing protein
MLSNLTLRTKIILLFSCFVFVAITDYVFVFWGNKVFQEDIAYAEISKQNTLQIQQVVFFIRNVTDGKKTNLNDVTREMKVFDDNFKILKEGGYYEPYNIKLPPTNPNNLEIYSKLTEVSRQWKDFRSRIVNIVDTNPIRLDSTFAYLALPDVDPSNMKTQKIEFLNPSITPHIDYVIKNTEKIIIFNEDLTTFYRENAYERKENYDTVIIMLHIFTIFLFIGAIYLLIANFITPINKIAQTASVLSMGEFGKNIDYELEDEIGELVQNINKLTDSMEKISLFASDVGKGNFKSELQVRGENDELGYALLGMRDNLQKVYEEDQKRNWANEGMAKFAEILRNTNQEVAEISYNIISNLVKYLGANQGGLFILHQVGDQSILKLTAAYAYNKKKYLQKEVLVGQGLLGQAVLEKNSIYLTEIPNTYITITSGLGEANPNTLLIVPLQANNTIYGVVEIASFHQLEDYQMDFVQKLSESIAITLATVQSTERNRKLLEESQMFAELMRAQEEEMRQNMEELTATQEEMRRVQLEIKEKEHQLNLMLNNTNKIMFSLDKQLVVRVTNKPAVDFFGERGIQIKSGANFLDNMPSTSQQLWREYLVKALLGETVRQFYTEKDANYEDMFFEIQVYPIINYENELEGLTVYIDNVSHIHPIRWE